MLGNYLSPRSSRVGRWLILLAAMWAFSLAACSDDAATATATASVEATSTVGVTETAAATEATPSPVEATDSSGTTLTLVAPAARIVSHSPALTEILFAIGAGDRVVAVDEFSNYPAEVADLPRVTYSSPDPEQDLSFEPDLVLFSGRQDGSLEHFRELELPVFYLVEPTDLEGVYESIRTLGVLTGSEEGAAAVVADMEARLAAVVEALEGVEDGPLVFYEITDDLYTVSPDSFIGAALTVLKVRNVAEGTEGAYPQLSSEAIVEANPDVILMADAAFVDPAGVPQRAGWSGITAVVEGRIHPVDGDIMSRPGPRIVQGIEDLAKLLYPDRFP